MEGPYLSIGDAAQQVRMTAETLRHYDRIGLVKPSKVDERTGYRYYGPEDIVRLNTVYALRQMDLPLREIKQVLEYGDLGQIVAFLDRAEQKADEKIVALQHGKEKIRLARADYERKLHGRQASEGIFTQELPQRTIMLADSVEKVTVDDLWSYQRHFYGRLTPKQRERFAFEDLAGVYRDGSSSRYLAVCTSYDAGLDRLITLPAGTYLCADCTEEDCRKTLERLLDAARTEYGAKPAFSLQLVAISGILQWNYQLQVYVGA